MNKQKILKSGSSYRLLDDFTIIEGLPTNHYSFDYDAYGSIFLSDMQEPKLPEKIYDNDKNFRNMVIKSYNHNENNTGVLFIGDKGTGKSVSAKLLAKEINIPVIHITKQILLEIDFSAFINKIQQEIVIFIDEFEKSFEDYDRENMKYHTQKSFLSLMDGSGGQYKRLFIFTSNSEINDYMNDRPSRIKYKKKYKGIDPFLVEQIIKDNIEDIEIINDLIENIDSETFTIDALMSIIKEIKIHNVKYSDFKDVFNFNPISLSFIISIINENGMVELLAINHLHHKEYLGSNTIYNLLPFIEDEKHNQFLLKKRGTDNSYIYKSETTNKLYEIKPQVLKYSLAF
jgi:hypothetical protein